jgi:hypothetical protein
MMELPSLKPLHGNPALFIMGLGYMLLLGTITFLAVKRAEYIDKERSELVGLLQKCLDDGDIHIGKQK